MYKKASALYHAKKLVICFGALLPLTLGAMEPVAVNGPTINVGHHAWSSLSLPNINSFNNTVGQHTHQLMLIRKMGDNSTINIPKIGHHASVSIFWWYGNPPRCTIENMGMHAHIYNGVSNLTYLASCSVALVAGIGIGYYFLQK
jgi:hypothetical protein